MLGLELCATVYTQPKICLRGLVNTEYVSTLHSNSTVFEGYFGKVAGMFRSALQFRVNRTFSYNLIPTPRILQIFLATFFFDLENS